MAKRWQSKTMTQRNNSLAVDPLPPHSLEAEKVILGCCLLDPDKCIPELVEVSGNDKRIFYDLRHQVIFQVLAELLHAGKPIVEQMLPVELRDRGLLDQAGGMKFLSEIPDTSPSPTNFSYFLDRILQDFSFRRIDANFEEFRQATADQPHRLRGRKESAT
jgi:replicative DNA helicase